MTDHPFVLSWRQLPPLPDPSGFASPFVGVDGDALLLAGGANFPKEHFWEGGNKTWHDRVFVLRPGCSQWELVGRLPSPVAYGLSLSAENGVLCAGGSDATRHLAAVFLMRWREGKLEFESLPSLPKSVAMGAGARVGDTIYLAGGLESPQSRETMNTFFSLDLNALAAGWRSLPTWPGPGRAQAVAAVVGDKFYLFSGFCRSYEKSGESEISYLKDAYCYSPQSGWQKLPDLPFPAAAAASPAAVVRSELLLIGGVDGTDADKAPQEFRHSSQRIQAYSVATKSWQTISRAPVGRVCVTTTEWLGRWILPTGESSPGVRSPEVWAMEAITRRE